MQQKNRRRRNGCTDPCDCFVFCSLSGPGFNFCLPQLSLHAQHPFNVTTLILPVLLLLALSPHDMNKISSLVTHISSLGGWRQNTERWNVRTMLRLPDNRLFGFAYSFDRALVAGLRGKEDNVKLPCRCCGHCSRKERPIRHEFGPINPEVTPTNKITVALLRRNI